MTRLQLFFPIHYLLSMCPVPFTQGTMALMVEPTPVWLAATGLVGLTLLVLVFAGLRIRRMEIAYASD